MFEKNYRLQDIQLSKIPPSRFARFRRSVHKPSFWLPPKPLPSPQRRLVENTGLEPVTSWLQTRRSPS